jgi:hypothetical protein
VNCLRIPVKCDRRHVFRISAHNGEERPAAARAETVDGEVVVEGGEPVKAEPLGHREAGAVGDREALADSSIARRVIPVAAAGGGGDSAS